MYISTKGNTVDNFTTPELMPILSGGGHSDPSQGACIMEMASYLSGDIWTDTPACTLPLIAFAAQAVNDELDDDERQQLLPLLPRLMNTAEPQPNKAQDYTERDIEITAQLVHYLLGRYAAQIINDQTREWALAWIERYKEAEQTFDADPSQMRKLYLEAHELVGELRNTGLADDRSDSFMLGIIYEPAHRYADIDGALDQGRTAWHGRYIAEMINETAEKRWEAHVPLIALLDEYDRITGRTEVEQLSKDEVDKLVELTVH